MFVVIEGIDGCGKTTQAKLLDAAFKEAAFDQACPWYGRGWKSIVCSDPGFTSVGKELRQLLLHADANPTTKALLFTAARSELACLIAGTDKPGANVLVIGDRWLFSTLAYQCAGGDVDRELVMDLADKFYYGVAPDLVFIIDVSVEVGMRRCREKHELNPSSTWDRFESQPPEFYEKLRRSYLSEGTQLHMAEAASWLASDKYNPLLAVGGRIRMIHGDQPPEKVHADIMRHLNAFFPTYLENQPKATNDKGDNRDQSK